MPLVRRPLLALLLSLVVLLSGGLPAAASTLEQRLEGWPAWSLPAPLPRPGARDLVYPAWFEGNWRATSADLSGVEPEIEYAVRFIQDPSGRIVGDRAFNANSVGRALLGEQLQRVRNDPQNPNRQLADLSGDRYLESTVVGAAANGRQRISSSQTSSACRCCMAPAIRASAKSRPSAAMSASMPIGSKPSNGR